MNLKQEIAARLQAGLPPTPEQMKPVHEHWKRLPWWRKARSRATVYWWKVCKLCKQGTWHRG